MRVYIVRHGHAADAPNDSARPLSARGREEVTRIAHFAMRAQVNVGQVWHSPKLRAKETAEVLARTAQFGVALTERDGLLPEDNPNIVLAELEVIYDNVCIVSHMPFVSYLASGLVLGSANPVLRFDTATMLCLEREALGAWRVVWHVNPGIV
jgi:phosphohistidine phosphatase